MKNAGVIAALSGSGQAAETLASECAASIGGRSKALQRLWRAAWHLRLNGHALAPQLVNDGDELLLVLHVVHRLHERCIQDWKALRSILAVEPHLVGDPCLLLCQRVDLCSVRSRHVPLLHGQPEASKQCAARAKSKHKGHPRMHRCRWQRKHVNCNPV